MNMTVVIVTRPMEFALLVLALAAAAVCVAPLASADETKADSLKAVADESRDLDDNQLGSLVRELGGQLEDDMAEEMDKLVRELEAKREKRQSPADGAVVERLRQANKLASQDIRARVEMVGDNGGALPQWSLGDKASSFLSATSQRLTSASSYVGNKLRSMGTSLARAGIPKRLKRFFKWPTFLSFKVRHHKVYKSAREELYRQMVFLRTHVKVGMQHLRFLLHRDRHLLGDNQYADMTQDEIYEALNNEELEAEKRELHNETPKGEHARTMAQLKKLAASKRNIFGQEVATGPANRLQHKLRKRSLEVGDDDDDDDELDADEEDFQNIGLDFEGEQAGSDDDDETFLDSEDTFKLVDEFANADLSGLDDLDSNLDDALNGANNKQNGNGGASRFEGIDLRKTGCIIKPENQNRCGNCYSQAVTATAAYYNCMGVHKGEMIRYNPYFPSTCGQYLFKDGEPKLINGCQGGRVSVTLRFVTAVGIPSFMDYNIARVSAAVLDSDQCAYSRPQGAIEEHGWPVKLHEVEHFKNSRYTLLQLDEVDLHLRTVGPVLVSIRTWQDFEFYEAGIYNGKDELQMPHLHSMLIVGHDRDPVSGLDYYIIWNSAGINWGENGYLRVSAESLDFFLLMLVGLPPNNIE